MSDECPECYCENGRHESDCSHAHHKSSSLAPESSSEASLRVRGMATGRITYIENGKEWRWDIGCMAWETPEHMKKHLAIWRPKAQFVSAEIIPDKPPND